MMVEYSAGAEKRVVDYLRNVRERLRTTESVDADEVANDLRNHIERELCEMKQPVSEADVNAVLNRLGPPEEVVKEEDMSWWAKMLLRWRRGPEDWRLAYLSFGVFVIGTLVAGPLGILAGFLLSRAAMSVAGEPEPRAKKWLIYPALIVVYTLAAGIGLFWPGFALGGLVAQLNHGHGSLLYKDPFFDNDGLGTVTMVLAGAALGLAVWWSLLWAYGRRHLSAVRTVFRPFAEKWTGRKFGKATLAAWAVTLVLASVAVLLWVLT